MTDLTELIFCGDLERREPKMMPLGNPEGNPNSIGSRFAYDEPRDSLPFSPEGITIAALTHWRGGRQILASGMPNDYFRSAECELAGPKIPADATALETQCMYNQAIGYAVARKWKEMSEVRKEIYVGPRFVQGMAMVDPEALGYDKYINPQTWQRPVDSLPLR